MVRPFEFWQVAQPQALHLTNGIQSKQSLDKGRRGFFSASGWQMTSVSFRASLAHRPNLGQLYVCWGVPPSRPHNLDIVSRVIFGWRINLWKQKHEWSQHRLLRNAARHIKLGWAPVHEPGVKCLYDKKSPHPLICLPSETKWFCEAKPVFSKARCAGENIKCPSKYWKIWARISSITF